MDQEEILQYSAKIIEQIGPLGEDIFSLGIHYERIHLFSKLRDAIQEKDSTSDAIAVEVLSWIWDRLASD
jgi:hypothetical protein